MILVLLNTDFGNHVITYEQVNVVVHFWKLIYSYLNILIQYVVDLIENEKNFVAVVVFVVDVVAVVEFVVLCLDLHNLNEDLIVHFEYMDLYMFDQHLKVLKIKKKI